MKQTAFKILAFSLIFTYVLSLSSCGFSDVGSNVSTQHTHTEVTDKAVASTCSKTGLTEGKHCSTCGEIIIAQKTVSKVQHKWDSGNTTTAPTCTKVGTTTFTCTVCKETKTEDIPSTGEHIYVKGKCQSCGAAEPELDIIERFLIYSGKASDAQENAVSALNSYIKTSNSTYLTYYFQYIQLAYDASAEMYNMSLDYECLNEISNDCKILVDTYDVLLEGGYDASGALDLLKTTNSQLTLILNYLMVWVNTNKP